MSEKEDVLKEILWLGIELVEDDYDETELTTNQIRKYIKNRR